jgi:hypothetical protein
MRVRPILFAILLMTTSLVEAQTFRGTVLGTVSDPSISPVAAGSCRVRTAARLATEAIRSRPPATLALATRSWAEVDPEAFSSPQSLRSRKQQAVSTVWAADEIARKQRCLIKAWLALQAADRNHGL